LRGHASMRRSAAVHNRPRPAPARGQGTAEEGTARTVARTHAACPRTRRLPPERASAVGIHACSAAPRRRRTATGRESWCRCVRGEPRVGRGHARRGCSRRSTAAATCSCFARRTYAGPAAKCLCARKSHTDGRKSLAEVSGAEVSGAEVDNSRNANRGVHGDERPAESRAVPCRANPGTDADQVTLGGTDRKTRNRRVIRVFTIVLYATWPLLCCCLIGARTSRRTARPSRA
jgi:hypothetical protein